MSHHVLPLLPMVSMELLPVVPAPPLPDHHAPPCSAYHHRPRVDAIIDAIVAVEIDSWNAITAYTPRGEAVKRKHGGKHVGHTPRGEAVKSEHGGKHVKQELAVHICSHHFAVVRDWAMDRDGNRYPKPETQWVFAPLGCGHRLNSIPTGFLIG